MRRRLLGVFLGLALGITSAWSDTGIVQVDAYPLMEVSVMGIGDGESGPEATTARVSFVAGVIDLVKRPESIKFRLTPLLFDKVKNQFHLHVTGLSPSAYVYDSKKGAHLELKGNRVDPSKLSLLSLRGKSDDPYLSGGMAALLGQIIGNYGYRRLDGSRERVCKLTEAFVYSNNEKHGKKLSSVLDWAFSYEWAHPEKEKTWEFGLAHKCLALGQAEGKTYGRFLWVPIGKAPKLSSGILEMKKKAKKMKQEMKSKAKGKRLSI